MVHSQGMRDVDLYAQILGVTAPWKVTTVDLDSVQQKVVVHLVYNPKKALTCPECDKKAPGYDTRVRRWRHLDTCQFQTILEAEVPRTNCPTHGVHQIHVPWSEPNSRFTALFEALVIDWLQEASISAVARLCNLSWDAVDGIMSRAVARGLARQTKEDLLFIGVDETSFQKRHEYVTVVSCLARGRVLYVADGHYKKALAGFYKGYSEEDLEKLEVVAMDMWKPYIMATREHVPSADSKIAFDRYHVAAHLNKAVDKVRRSEHRKLLENDDQRLTKTKYLWLQNPENMKAERRVEFSALKASALKTARAWAIKQAARDLWEYQTEGWARRGWLRWYGWAIRSRLEPVKHVARMVKTHLQGIITAVITYTTNAMSEGLNSVIQMLKKRACGFRNRERFRNAIYFHLGDLDLYPKALAAKAGDSAE